LVSRFGSLFRCPYFIPHSLFLLEILNMNNKKGFTLVELLVVIAIIPLLIGLLLPALAKARQNAASLKDKTQIQQIHKGALTFANDAKGKLPTPGLINRLPDNPAPPGVGNQPGIGPEDFTQNTTPRLYSAMIAQNFFTPEICIGTTEVSNRFKAKAQYDYNAYKPANDVYWDDTFLGDPSVANADCNTSYSHMGLFGARKRNNWKDNQSSAVPVFGTRGTGGTYNGQAFGGSLTGDEYTKSPTLELHGPKQQWNGHVCFNDNHAETLDTFFHPLVAYYPQNSINQTKDNIFAAEFTDFLTVPGGTALSSNDAYLGMFSAADNTGNNGTPKFDPLTP